MSRLLTGISGALALALISGAAQFASGRDLGRDFGGLSQINQPNQPSSALSLSSSSLTSVVNRGAKADRVTGPSGSPALTRTVSLEQNGFSDTTILVRLPIAAANSSAASPSAKPITRKLMLACEPVVSVLTEAAKFLQPGRCIT